VSVALYVPADVRVSVTAQVATPGCATWTRGAVESASADVTLIVIDRPRVAIDADGRMPKAFISKPTDWTAVSVPSVADTSDV
jgi:hypothetical protein